jgi:hypothetical protein
MSSLSKPYLQATVSHSGREEEDEAPLLLWLCPHTCLTLDQARVMFLYRPPDAENGYGESFRTCHDKYCCFEVSNGVIHSFVDQHTLILRTHLTLFRVQGCEDYNEASKRSFTVQRVGLALSHLKFPICRHIRTDDFHVLDHFTPSCIYLPKEDGTKVPCTCKNLECPGSHTGKQHYRACLDCRREGCYTAFGFLASPTSWDGRRDLELHLDLFRDLGCMENSHAPGWRCHAYDKGSMDQIAQNWQLWIDSIGQEEIKSDWLSKSFRLDRIANFFIDKLGVFKPTSSSTLSISPRGHNLQSGNERAQGSETPRRNKLNTCREIRYPHRIPRRKCVLMCCRHGSKNIHPSARGGFRC